MKELNSNEEIQVHLHSVGKIDKNIYLCVTGDIVRDEVIITDKQIEHIMSRHPNDYERYQQYLSEIVSDPDYIIEASRPKTALAKKQENSLQKGIELLYYV